MKNYLSTLPIFLLGLYILFRHEQKWFSLILFLPIVLIFLLDVWQQYLRKKGIHIKAEVVKTEVRNWRRGMRRYRLVLAGTHPTSGASITFYSPYYEVPHIRKNWRETISLEPTAITFKNKTGVSVYLHPKNEKWYFVDFPAEQIKATLVENYQKQNPTSL